MYASVRVPTSPSATRLMRYMINKIEALPGADPVRVAFFAYLNKNNAGTFFTDGNATTGSTTRSDPAWATRAATRSTRMRVSS